MRYQPATGTPEELADVGYTDRSWDQPQFLIRGQLTTEERMPTVVLEPDRAATALPAGPGMDLDAETIVDPLTGRTLDAGTFLDRRLYNDGLLVFHDGAVCYERYRSGLAPTDRHLVHSVTKTLTTMAVGIAADEGLLDTTAPVRAYVPELAAAAWDGVTVQHVLDMATGIHTEEHYEDAGSMYWRYAAAIGYHGTTAGDGGALGFVVDNLRERTSPPGGVFNYASYLTNLLPLCVEAATGAPATERYEAIFRAVGPEHEGTLNCDGRGHPIVEGQLSLTLRDLTRWALLYLHDGRNLLGEQVLPQRWVDETLSSAPDRRAAFERSDYASLFEQGEYHNQTWLVDPARGVAAMLGIHGQFVMIDRERDLLVAGLSSYPTQLDPLMAHSVLATFNLVQGLVAS